MNLKEHEKNIITKEKTDVEKYLLRIIQRYFDIENNFTKESIEEMIIESLTRFKRLIISEKGFIFSLNKRTGHLNLTIRDFSGEEAFNKSTAFNKDFGIDEDTVCEGNDIRLSDKRKSLYHNHVIGDVKGLQEAIDAIVLPTGNHIHNNKTVLDMIRYTGTRTEIDLITLEYLEVAINEYYKNLEYYHKELEISHKLNLETMTDLMAEVLKKLQEAKDIVENAKSWVEQANKYTNDKLSNFNKQISKELLDYVTDADVTSLTDFLKKPYHVITDGEIPITNGTITYTPIVEEEIIEAGSEEGDALKDIYDNGLRLGKDDWAWDNTNKSFVYQSNEMTTYPMFASLNKFMTYTHRVTLASVDSDDDIISVVLAYDEDTQTHLSLLVTCGGVSSPQYSGASAVIVIADNNMFLSSHSVPAGNVIIGKNIKADSSSYSSWSSLNNGITILVKKVENVISIWINNNTPNTWTPEEKDGTKDIYPTTSPDLELDLTSVASCNVFVDKKANYGYGCFSQSMSTYKDVYFISAVGASSGPIGHTNVNESTNIKHNVPSNIMSKVHNGKIKMFFRYEDKNGDTVNSPLPYSFIDRGGMNVIIQGTYTSNGEIGIRTNFINKVPGMTDKDNLYDANTLIIADNRNYLYSEISSMFDEIQYNRMDKYNICLIDSITKNTFISKLLTKDKRYFIQGLRNYSTGNFIADNGIALSYFNWDTGEPSSDYSNNGLCVCNGKWNTLDVGQNEIGFINEYKIQRLTDYFNNPRIYYQVLGNEEVI